jgi:hypothetical protein
MDIKGIGSYGVDFFYNCFAMEPSNKPSASLKGGKFLAQLSEKLLLK